MKDQVDLPQGCCDLLNVVIWKIPFFKDHESVAEQAKVFETEVTAYLSEKGMDGIFWNEKYEMFEVIESTLNHTIMKKLIFYGIYVFIGAVFIALSETVNPGYGMLQDWSYLLGASIVTLSLTAAHAEKEATRIIKGAHFGRFVLRGLYFALLSLMIFREVSFISAVFALNQALLFGVFFDPLRNANADVDLLYHGGEAWYDRVVKAYALEVFFLELIGFGITAGVLLI